ncbi:MAG TPA: PAS domain S-box protein, partial [Candidatus Edwardsbacteria bacterium]|nr:PAS domain S-box protein [Candidatus Edwardsbacteria bacterium]
MTKKTSTTSRPAKPRTAARAAAAAAALLPAGAHDHLRAILDLAEDAVYVKDTKRRYLLVNPAAVRFLGRPAKALLGRTDEQVFGAALSREVAAHDRTVLRTRRALTYERRGLSAGKPRVFLTTKVPYVGADGTLLGLIGISREITERKSMEEALAASEAKHRLLLDSIQAPVLALDDELTITYCNRAYAAFVGKDVAELEGRDLLKAFPRLRASKTYQAYRDAIRTGRPQTVEGKMGDRYIFARVFRTPAGLLAIAEDVTERKHAEQELQRVHQELEARVAKRTESLSRTNRALQQESDQRQRTERALRDSEHKFRAILENSLDVITILNEDGVIKYANPSLSAVLGIDHREVLGRSVFDYLHPSDIPRAIKALSEVQQRPGAAMTIELRLRHADGGWRLLEISGKYIPQSQILGGIVINARDVTQGRQAADEIRESEERQRLLFDLAPDAYFLCDLKGVLIDCNQSCLRLTGRSKPELTGHSPWELGLIPMEQAPELTALLSQNATGSAAGPEEFTIAAKGGGPINAAITTHPVKLKGQPLVLGIIADITEAKHRRDREREQFRELEFLSRTAMDFVSMGPERDIYAYICEQLGAFCNGAIVGINVADPAAGAFRFRAVAGLGPLQPVIQGMLGFDLPGKSFADVPPDTIKAMSAARLDRLAGGLHELLFRAVPAALCREVEKRAGITEVHAMGIVAKGRLIGSVAILSRGGRLANPATVATFINQAAVALERKQDEEQLRHDVEERERTAAALHSSEEFSRAMIDHSPLGISVRDSDGRLLACNATWRKIWGVSQRTMIEDITANQPELLIHGDRSLLGGWQTAVQRVSQDGGTLYIPELRIDRGPAGGAKWVALHLAAVTGAAGAVERVITVTEDISERVASQQQLRHNEQHFRALIEHSSDMITILDKDGVIRYMSPSGQRELGYAPGGMVGSNV